jgi:DNA-binding CsgD family transcriptional regulator
MLKNALFRKTVLHSLGVSTLTPWLAVVRDCLTSYDNGTFSDAPTQITTTAFLLGALFALICGLFVLKRLPMSYRRFFIVLFGLFTVFGAVTALLGLEPGNVSLYLKSVGAFCYGSALACGLLFWEPSIIALPQDKRLVVVLSALLVAILMVLLPLDPWMYLLVALGMNSISLVCMLLVKDEAQTPEQEIEHESAGEKGLLALHMRKITLRLFASAILIGLPFATMSNLFFSLSQAAPYPHLPIASLIGLTALAALVLVIRVVKKEFDQIFAFRIAIIAVFPAFFPIDIGGALGGFIALYGTLIASCLVLGLLILIYYDIIAVFYKAKSSLLGIAWLGLLLGALAGTFFGGTLHNSFPLLGTEQGILLLSLSGLMSIISVFVATNVLINQEMLRSARMVAADVLPTSYSIYGAMRDQSDDAGIIDAGKSIALKKGLTEREAEVMLILAKGNSLARVQESLFLSQGTVITHRNSIYKKLSIHSKQELIDYVEEVRLANK